MIGKSDNDIDYGMKDVYQRHGRLFQRAAGNGTSSECGKKVMPSLLAE